MDGETEEAPSPPPWLATLTNLTVESGSRSPGHASVRGQSELEKQVDAGSQVGVEIHVEFESQAENESKIESQAVSESNGSIICGSEDLEEVRKSSYDYAAHGPIGSGPRAVNRARNVKTGSTMSSESSMSTVKGKSMAKLDRRTNSGLSDINLGNPYESASLAGGSIASSRSTVNSNPLVYGIINAN